MTLQSGPVSGKHVNALLLDSADDSYFYVGKCDVGSPPIDAPIHCHHYQHSA